jgi:hypothetical protein
MTGSEAIRVQRMLTDQGFDPGPVDGIWGPKSAAAYEHYWSGRHVEISVPVVTPSAAKPWWQSRRIIGAVVAVAAIGAGFAGLEVDARETTELVMQAIALIGAVVAWWGGLKAERPIDPGLVMPGVRIPQRMREHGGRNPAQSVPAHGVSKPGYWSGKRGPLDDH